MSHRATEPTLVMGASGTVGRLVFEQLREQGVPVRVSVRGPEPGSFPADVRVHTADLTDPSSLAPAFEGVGQVFLHAVHQGIGGVIDALRAAQVERVVLLSSGSVLQPSSAGNPIAEEHREVEQAFLSAADLTVVPIRPLVLATNALGWAHPIRAAGSISLYRPDAALAPIHERDVAAVAVEALSGRDDVSDILTGPHRLTQHQQVAALGAAIGREVRVEELSRDEALAQFLRFMPRSEATGILQYLDDAAAGNSGATSAVVDVLGRPALSFDAWAAEHADEFR